MPEQESSLAKARRYALYAEQSYNRSGDGHEHTMRMATLAAEVSQAYSALAQAEFEEQQTAFAAGV